MRIDTKKKSRGRPRAFDEVDAREQILNYFWEHGFTASSLDELSAATGLGRPSLYGAFGNKEAMYLGALALFKERMTEAVSELLASADGRAGLEHFFARALDLYRSRGCLFVCTATVEAPSSPAIAEALGQALQELDRGLVLFFERFSPGPEAEVRGRLSACLLHSISVRVRAGESQDSLVALVRQGVTLLWGSG